MTNRRLAIRADAAAGVGAGHVMRSLALADAWRRSGGAVEWFSASMPETLSDLIAGRGITHHQLSSPDDWDLLCAWALRHAAVWVAVDGYPFAAGPAKLQAAGARVLVVDDTGAWPRYDCDLLLNQNPGADTIPYRTTAIRRLCGPNYALIRDEFTRLEPAERAFDRPAARVLVSFGGHDAQGQAARVARLLTTRRPSVAVDVVAGVMVRSPHTTTDLAPFMRSADAAVVAAGSICWELCYLGVPALGLIVADNQEAVAAGLDRAGALRNLGWYDAIDDDALAEAMTTFLDDPARAEMSRLGRTLVDGHGAQRALDAMLAIERSSARGGAMA